MPRAVFANVKMLKQNIVLGKMGINEVIYFVETENTKFCNILYESLMNAFQYLQSTGPPADRAFHNGGCEDAERGSLS